MILSSTADRPGAHLVRGGVIAALVLSASGAFAQRPGGDQAAADALYKEGRDLVKAGQSAAGCAKFEASLALSPAASTMLNIARCHEQEGKLATAFADYTRALGLNGDTPGVERRKELEELAHKGLGALGPRLPRLRFVITTGESPSPGSAKSPPPGVQATSDGKDIPAAALGEALPADPGPHQVRVSAPGYGAETRSVVLEEGKTAVVEITLQRPARGWSRPAGIALTTVGAAGLGIGAVTGIVSLLKVGDIKARCGGVHCPASDTADRDALSSATTLGNVSTAGFVAGGALAAVGVVLLVLPAGRDTPGPVGHTQLAERLRVSVGPGRFELRGSF